MAFALGDSFILATALVTPAISTPGVIADGTTDFLLFGMIVNSGSLGVWNNGEIFNQSSALVRRVLPTAGSTAIVGATVQVTGKSTYFRGVVIAALQIELGTTGGTGAETECVYVRGNGGNYFLATLASVEEVPG